MHLNAFGTGPVTEERNKPVKKKRGKRNIFRRNEKEVEECCSLQK